LASGECGTFALLAGVVVEIKASEWLLEVLDRVRRVLGGNDVLYHSLFELASPRLVLGALSAITAWLLIESAPMNG